MVHSMLHSSSSDVRCCEESRRVAGVGGRTCSRFARILAKSGEASTGFASQVRAAAGLTYTRIMSKQLKHAKMRAAKQSRMDAALKESLLWRRQRANIFHGAQVTPSGSRALVLILCCHGARARTRGRPANAASVGPEAAGGTAYGSLKVPIS